MTTNNIPTIAEVQEAKLNMDSITEFIQSTMDTLVDQYGGTRRTLQGINSEADAAIASVGANTIGDYSTNPVLANANDTAYYSGDGLDYKTKQGVSRPYTCDSTTYPDPNDDPNLQKYNQRDQVTSIAALQARGTETGYSVYLSDGGRSGWFEWKDDKSYEAEVTADTRQGIYVAPDSDLTGASGAWVRQYTIRSWGFYGIVADGVTNNIDAFKAINHINESISIPSGEYYIDGDGSTESILEWFADDELVEMYGEGNVKLTCSSSVVNLMAVTGVHIHHIEFDGGFDPTVNTANLTPLLVTNQNSKVTFCKIRNTYGSNLFGKFGPVIWENNDLGNYGDHAMYMSISIDEVDLGTYTEDVIASRNIIVQNPSYANNPGNGVREAIKVRNSIRKAAVDGNIMKGVGEGILFESDSGDYLPEQISAIGNIIESELSAVGSTYTGISFAKGDSLAPFADEIIVANNTLTGQSDGNGTGIALSYVGKVKVYGNTIKGYNIGIGNAGSNENGGVGTDVYLNTISDCQYGIFQLGEGAKIRHNTIYGFATAGIRDKYGNKVDFNDIESSETSASGIIYLTEGNTSQPRSTARYNNIRSVENGIQLSSKVNAMDIIGNTFEDCSSHSIWNINSDVALEQSEYYGNVVVSGVELDVSDPQSVKLTTGAAGLPTASENYRGKFAMRESSNVDTVFVCVKTAVGVYEWQAIN